MPLLNTVAPTLVSVTVEAVITRADGTVEDRGVVSAGYSSPFRQAVWQFKQWLSGKTAGRVTIGASNV